MPCSIALSVAFVLIAAAPAVLAQKPVPGARASAPLATRDLDVEGVVAEVIESVRTGDTLSVRVRLRNTGPAPAKVMLARGGQSYHTANYLVAGDTRYEILRDTAGNVLATPRDGGGWLEPTIRPGGTFSWWATYPAPPAALNAYTLYLNVGPPIPDVPIVDK